MNLNLKRFDIKSITPDKVCVFIGKRETGKSFLVKDLLWHNKDMPCGTVISGTEAANGFYSSIMPSLFIHEAYTPEIVANVLKRQRLMLDEMKKPDKVIDPRTFFILDDCLYDNTWIRDTNIRSLFMNGRHFKVFFIITMQYALGVTPNLRTNIDYVFILRENFVSNRKRLYEHYAGMFPSFDIFAQVMDACTENYECLVIHNNAKSNKLEDQVFWYKADPHPDFKIGDSIYWKKHNELYGNRSMLSTPEDENEEILNSGRKRGPLITVKKNGF